MPIPKPKQNEDKQKFISRCMEDPVMRKEYPDNKQRIAVCLQKTQKSKSDILSNVIELLGLYLNYDECEECGSVEEVTAQNYTEPKSEDYVDFKEEVIEISFEEAFGTYIYKDPITMEMFYYQNPGIYKKNGRTLTFVSKAAKYQGKTVKLNKPFRTPDGPKKFSVYVKNDKGNVVKVNFGDPNMKIKKNIPERRKSFRARHNCDNPGPKWKARYWSCKAW
jgi:hypothetical protein